MLVKIGLKLILSVGLSIIIIIGVFAYFSIQSQTDALLAEIEHNNNQLAEAVMGSTRFDMLLNNREHLHKIISTIGNQPSILDVRVFNKEGVIIYSSDKNQVGNLVDKRGEACFTCHATDQPLEQLSISDRTRVFEAEGHRVMGTILPLYNEPACYTADCHAHEADQKVLGVIDVTESLALADSIIAGAKLKILIFTLMAILGTSIVVWFFVRVWIDKPVRELVEATKHVAAGNLNYRVANSGADEMGILARSFNHMIQKLAEARLQLFQSDKMASLGRLAAGVAHEINNPLTGILTYSSFLLKRSKQFPDLKDDLEVIVHETKRSREIVKGLLDFARQSVPKKNHYQISQIIDRSVSVLDNQLNLKEIELVRSYQENLPDAYVDSNQMQQVFMNLVVNSIHACPKQNGRIDISTGLLSLAPFGITQIKSALCPKGHNLIDSEIKIGGMPSIRLQARVENKEGFIYLDPIYGKHNNHYGIKMDDHSHVELSCPKCNMLLMEKQSKCPKCKGPVYYFEIPGKGKFQGCSVKGCDWQFWEKIEGEGQKEYLDIRVTDNGCGIPPEMIDKIFDPFFTTKGQNGTGLGLAVIWGIIDNHDGQISVTSQVGEGTTFSIRLPVSPEGA